MIYQKGTEDWCHPKIEKRLGQMFDEETMLVVVYDDCWVYHGVTTTGVVEGTAKVVEGNVVWVKCTDAVPKFKERFYDSF